MGSRDASYTGGPRFKSQILFYKSHIVNFNVWQQSLIHPLPKERDSLILLWASKSICVSAGNPFDINMSREKFQPLD
jgi:hypothetical protein